MQEIAINNKDKLVMKLLHYFITDKGYNPVILHGVKNEIWLENLNSDYKIIRIVSNYIHNNEQLDLDIARTKRVLKSIQRKTFSFNMDTLSIFVDIGDNVSIKEEENMDIIQIDTEKDINSNTILLDKFPDIISKTKFECDDVELLVKLTGDINKNREDENAKIEEVFKNKIKVVMPAILLFNFIVFLLAKYNSVAILENVFYNDDIYALIIGMFSTYMIGSKIEGFYGKVSTIMIYIYTCIISSLMAIKLGINSSYVGATFGFLGALINFGSYYRVYLNNILKTLIIPIVGINVLYIILTNQAGLIVVAIISLISGVTISRALGVEYKQTKNDLINSYIMSALLLAFLIIINLI